MSSKIYLQNIDAVVFDLGGVLLNLDINRTRQAFVAAGVANFDAYFALGHADAIFKQYEVGAVSDDQFITGLVELSGNKMDPAGAITAWNAMLLDFPPQRIELLERLGVQKRLFLYSNTNAIHHSWFSAVFVKQFGKPLDHYFEKTYYSQVIGLRKPDREGFDYITKDARIDPNTTLFIDDAKVNIEGAKEAGWQTHWLQPGEELTKLF